MDPLLVYLLIINASGLLLMLLDKHKAKEKMWRIPEAFLMGVAVLGGSLGCVIGMRLFHHKTRKPMFSIGLPLILAVQIVLVVFLFR